MENQNQTETENGSNEDDVQATKDDIQAMDKSDIMGKSLAPRCRTSRVVNLSSVRIKRLNNTFSESLLPCFPYNQAHCIKLLKLLCV